MALAAFVLELATASLDDQWKLVRPQIEWACAILREGDQTPFERVWHLASIALALSAADYDLLRSPDARGYRGFGRANQRRFDHGQHGHRRFPDDIELTFAVAVIEAAYATPPWPNGDRWDRIARPPARRVLSRQAAEELRPFLTVPDVSAEAHLRLGLLLALGLEQPEDALRHFGEADRGAAEPFVSYLARYSAGRLQAQYGNLAEARRAYEAALVVLPGAQSASLSLAYLLLAGGEAAGAATIMQEALREPRPDDPFWRYGLGRQERTEHYLDRLRVFFD